MSNDPAVLERVAGWIPDARAVVALTGAEGHTGRAVHAGCQGHQIDEGMNQIEGVVIPKRLLWDSMR